MDVHPVVAAEDMIERRLERQEYIQKIDDEKSANRQSVKLILRM